jgi:hypothetical protein
MGRSLLSSFPDEVLAKHWGPIVTGSPGTSRNSQDNLRLDLLNWAQHDEEVRRWIVGAWRETHPDVVAAADQVVIEGLAGHAARTLEAFAPEEMLLAFLTDEFDDGRALAKDFVSRLQDDDQRRRVQIVLGHLVGHQGNELRRRIRVVILGGHPRDESKLGPRLFEASPFEVRWRTFEKNKTGGVVQKAVVSAVRHADAALIITGMASHALMHFAKDSAQRSGVPWRCIDKATDKQVTAALHQLFPELTATWE